jgi:hypothetical protein
MTNEANTNEHGDQDPEVWSPTTREEMEKVIRWVGAEIEQLEEGVRAAIDELREKAKARGIDEAKWMKIDSIPIAQDEQPENNH